MKFILIIYKYGRCLVINILHISDIHFRANEDAESTKSRKVILEDFINYICSLDNQLRPDIVIVTGDIAYYASREDYELAIAWFEEFSLRSDISKNNFFFCPGNHDVDRRSRTIKTILDIRNNFREADRDFEEWQHKFSPLFEEYTKFCYDFGCIPFRFGRKSKASFLLGGRTIHKGVLNVVCLNSAWYHFDQEEKVKGNLWLGLPLIKEMNNHQLIDNSNFDDSSITIALCHHTEDWLHGDETTKYTSRSGNREVTWDYLKDRIHIFFHGHIDGENTFYPQRNGKRGYQIKVGTLYTSPSHTHSFNIVHLNIKDRKFSYYPFQYKGGEWGMISPQDDNLYSLISKKIDFRGQIQNKIIPDITFEITTPYLRFYHNCYVNVRFVCNKSLGLDKSFNTKIAIIENDENISISNDEDATRCLIFNMCNNKNCFAKMNISLPENRYGSVVDTLFREKLFEYISYDGKYEISFDGHVIATGKIGSNVRMRPSKLMIDKLEKLLQIEKYFNIQIYLPQEIYESDLNDMGPLIEIATKGYTEKNVRMTVTFPVVIKELREFLTKYDEKRTFDCIKISANKNFKIINTDIPVGKEAIILKNFELVNYANICSKCKVYEEKDTIQITAQSGSNGRIVSFYEKYSKITKEDIIADNICVELSNLIMG